MKKINNDLMNQIPGVIVTIQLNNLFNYFGKSIVLDVFYGKYKDAIITRHLNNLINTYGGEVFQDVLNIVNIERTA